MKAKTKRIFLQVSILCVSIVFILIGLARGEHVEVMGKAIRICLECIGIG